MKIFLAKQTKMAGEIGDQLLSNLAGFFLTKYIDSLKQSISIMRSSWYLTRIYEEIM